MTDQEKIEALEKRIAELEAKLAMVPQIVQHHHYHTAPLIPHLPHPLETPYWHNQPWCGTPQNGFRAIGVGLSSTQGASAQQ